MALHLIDGTSALVVFGGTILATFLRSGWRETGITLRALGQIGQRGFDADSARAELAKQVRAIGEDGLLRAPVRQFGDEEFDDATAALFHERSIPALVAAHDRHRTRRLGEANIAVRVLAQAAELAPVFGMAGTLIALNRMVGAPLDGGAAMTGAIGMAVVTTLYGILAANLVLAPLARVVERAAKHEEAQRQSVVDWLAQQLAEVCPNAMPHEHAAPVHHVAHHPTHHAAYQPDEPADHAVPGKVAA